MSARSLLARILLFSSIVTPIATSGAAGAASRVTNVAKASWETSGGIRTIDSNTVVLTVEDDGATIDTFTPENGSNAGTSSNSICRGTGAQSGSGANGQGRESVVLTRQVTAGDDLIFTLNYPAGNADSATADTMIAVLTTRSGDRETLTVSETGPATGKFTGRIATASAPPRQCMMTAS